MKKHKIMNALQHFLMVLTLLFGVLALFVRRNYRMNKSKILNNLQFSLLMLSLVFTITASFMPFSIGVFLGLSAVCQTGYAICLFAAKEERPKWLPVSVSAFACVSDISTLILIIGRHFGLYVYISCIDLILIAFVGIYSMFRKTKPKAAYGIITAVCLIFTAFGAFSHITYGRSIMSTTAEWVLKSNKVYDEEVASVFQELTDAGETSFSAAPSLFTCSLSESEYDGMNVVYVNQESSYDQVVFYIHGGYYVYQMGSEQMTGMNRLAEMTNSMIVMPVYPLAPFHTVENSFDTMIALYQQICADNADKKITLMGDSAGGGYSLALAEGLAERELDQPDELVLLSPWVDVTMSNPDISSYNDTEPILTVTMGQTAGKAWAGDLPMNDWRVSPIYGDLSELKNVTIFVGTRELFYPDDTLLYEKLKGNPNVTLYVGKGQNHVYPVYPTIEGRIALEQIADIVQR